MRRAERGFTLIEVLVIGTILGVIVAFTGTLVTQLIRSQKRDEFSSMVTEIRDNFVEAFRDPASWKETVANNGAPPPNGAPAQIKVYGADGNLFLGYDEGVATNGFDPTGALCNTYTAAVAGNPNCPIRFSFRWETANPTGCVGAGCVPRVNIYITVSINPGTTSPYASINPGKFAVQFTRAGESTTVIDMNCPSAMLVVGFDANGQAQCELASTVQANATPPPPPPPPPLGGPGPSPSPIAAPSPKGPAPAPKGK